MSDDRLSRVYGRVRQSEAARQGIGLATFVGIGAGLNALKFAFLPVVLSARALDVVTIGLLITVTCAQVVGEALANFAVTCPDKSSGVKALLMLSTLLAVGVVEPGVITAVLAPGRSLGHTELLSIRLFCLSAIGMLVLWRLGGLAQRHLDFWALKAVNVTPNLAIIVGALIPVHNHLLAISALMLAAVISAVLIAARRGRRRANALAAEVQAKGTQRSLGALLLLSLTTYLNLLLLRIVGARLPAGSLGAIYIAVGIIQLPVMLVAGASASTMLPRWVASMRTVRERLPIGIAAAVVTIATAVMLTMLVVLMSLRGIIRAHVDPAVYRSLIIALPVLAAGVPLYSATWLVRAYAIAVDRVRPLIVGTAVGALCVPLGWGIAPTVAGLTAGYAIGHLAWLAAFGVLLVRDRRVADAGLGHERTQDSLELRT